MIISMFIGGRYRRNYVVYLFSLLLGALASFIYASSLGFYNSPSRLLFRGLLGPSILSRARYTNTGYPKGMPMTFGVSVSPTSHRILMMALERPLTDMGIHIVYSMLLSLVQIQERSMACEA
jgi:hypothetical protein